MVDYGHPLSLLEGPSSHDVTLQALTWPHHTFRACCARRHEFKSKGNDLDHWLSLGVLFVVVCQAEELHAAIRAKRETRLAELKAKEAKEAKEEEAKAAVEAVGAGGPATGEAEGPIRSEGEAPASSDEALASHLAAATISDAPPANVAG